MDEIISIGAEALIIKSKWFGLDVIIKKRIPKPYRIKELDDIIRTERTIMEARIMMEVKKLGIPCPTILEVDPENAVIIMDYIEGEKLSKIVTKLSKEDLSRIFTLIGEYLGKMHKHGIIHGDLTTSNIIVSKLDNKIYLIDFGLSTYSKQLEDRGVDVHLFLRAIESTHYGISKFAFNNFLKGYEKIMGKEETNKIVEKVKEIRMRGRYVEERRKKY